MDSTSLSEREPDLLRLLDLEPDLDLLLLLDRLRDLLPDLDLDPDRLLDLEPVRLRDLLRLPDLLEAAEPDLLLLLLLLPDLDLLLLPLLLRLRLRLLSPAEGLLDLLFSLDPDLDLAWPTAWVSSPPSSLD